MKTPITTFDTIAGFPKLIVADNFVTRLRGLLGRSLLPDDTALLIIRCNCVHTFWMRFPIDVIFLDQEGTVLSVIDNVPARRVIANYKAWQVLECGAGQAQVRAICPGTFLEFNQCGDKDKARQRPWISVYKTGYSLMRFVFGRIRD